MKKHLLSVFILSIAFNAFSQNVRTSIADGLGTNIFVWDCTCLPLPNDSIIINHRITLNVDFGFTDGAVVINSPGELVGDSPNRAFAFNGSANFINHGKFNVARTAFGGGSAYSDGTFTADSFYTAISTPTGWVSNGNMTINYSYWNTGKFTLGPGSTLIIGDNFYNGDSLITGVNASLINSGGIRINGDFANSDTIRGTGQVCIYGNSVNIGVITGTLDMCDNTGGNVVDYNFGTIAPSVTTCTTVCNIGLENISEVKAEVYPNPSSDMVQFRCEKEFDLILVDMMGKQVYHSSNPSLNHTVFVNEWANGVYTYRIITNGGTGTGKFIKQ